MIEGGEGGEELPSVDQIPWAMIKTVTESGVLFLIDSWFSPETLVSFVPYQKETCKVTIKVMYK